MIQGGVGFGLGLVAAPVMAIADPRLVPATLLVVTSVMPLLTVFREIRHVDWSGLGWALVGRLPGTVIGAYAVVLLSPRALGIVVGVVVLTAVALSLAAWRPQPTPRALLTGGFVGGITGTATSIGGPPVALLYQHASGPRIRATLGAYFLAGALVSLMALVLAGEVSGTHLRTALALLPFLVAGFALSGPLRRFSDAGRTRGAVLGLITVSAVALLARSLLS